jgi:hypothetical protein
MQSEDTQKMISMDVNLMVSTAMKLMCKRSESAVPLTTRGVDQEDDDDEENSWSGWKRIHESHCVYTWFCPGCSGLSSFLVIACGLCFC